jgi:hypothetical protein
MRHWYTIAKTLQRDDDYLKRIAALGHQFKRTYGDADPDKLEAFTGWTTSDREHCLWDLSVQAQRTQTRPSTNAHSLQLDLFDQGSDRF